LKRKASIYDLDWSKYYTFAFRVQSCRPGISGRVLEHVAHVFNTDGIRNIDLCPTTSIVEQHKTLFQWNFVINKKDLKFFCRTFPLDEGESIEYFPLHPPPLNNKKRFLSISTKFFYQHLKKHSKSEQIQKLEAIVLDLYSKHEGACKANSSDSDEEASAMFVLDREDVADVFGNTTNIKDQPSLSQHYMFPIEILQLIFSFLDLETLVRCLLVSKR
jgi:hypothetical protein